MRALGDMEGVTLSGFAGAARIGALVVAIVLALWLGVRAAVPPAVVPATAPATQFSADRAMPDVRTIATRPHPVGSTDILRVQSYLGNRLRMLGIEPEERHYLIDPQSFLVLHRWNHNASPASELTDLIGVLPGKDRLKPAVALMAHVDTVWGSPGGGDDSVGVASILEILRAIKARGTPERDVVVLLTDGEEVGLAGARAFWPSDGLADHVGVVINLEARGAGGRATMFETGDANGAMIDLMGNSLRHPVANSMAVMAYRLMPNNTDFTPVRERGLPGFNFAIMGRAAYYHSPRATADRLDPRSLQDMGDQVLELTSALANAKVLPAAAPDAVFFDIAGHHLLSYGTSQGWWLVLIAAVGLAIACAGLRRAELLSTWDAYAGVVAFVWLIAHGLLLLTAFNLVSGSAAHPNYYDRLAALSRLEAEAVLACLGALIGWLALRRFPRRAMGLAPGAVLGVVGWALGGSHGLIFGAAAIGMLTGWLTPSEGASRWGGWIGAIGMLLVIAVVIQAKAPMAAWIIVWPVLVISVAAALIAWLDPRFARPWSWVFPAFALMMVTVLLVPLAHLAFLGIGGPLPETMLAFLLPVAAAGWPLGRIERAGQVSLLVVGAILVAGLAIAIQVRTDPIADTIPAYSLDK